MKNVFLVITLFVVLIFAACAKKNSPGKTVKVKTTTYTADVVPLMQAKCNPCHLPTKGGRKADFENYASAVKYAADMVTRIQLNPTDKGFMPFKNAKLSDEEIAVFKKWVGDGLLEK